MCLSLYKYLTLFDYSTRDWSTVPLPRSEVIFYENMVPLSWRPEFNKAIVHMDGWSAPEFDTMSFSLYEIKNLGLMAA